MLQQKQNKDRKTQVSIFYCTQKQTSDSAGKIDKEKKAKFDEEKTAKIHQHSLFNYFIISLAVLITSICIATRFSRFKLYVQL